MDDKKLIRRALKKFKVTSKITRHFEGFFVDLNEDTALDDEAREVIWFFLTASSRELGNAVAFDGKLYHPVTKKRKTVRLTSDNRWVWRRSINTNNIDT